MKKMLAKNTGGGG
jgi:superfamily II RNA helicase